jgi:hypothetical protein
MPLVNAPPAETLTAEVPTDENPPSDVPETDPNEAGQSEDTPMLDAVPKEKEGQAIGGMVNQQFVDTIMEMGFT